MTESTARAERAKPQSSTSPSYLWEVVQKPVSVRLPYGMIDRLEKEVVENFRSLTSRGSEIGGLLLGDVSGGNPALVTVDDFELVECDYSRGPLYRLSDADMGRFEKAVQQRQGSGQIEVVGFFRSHTRKGLSLDAEDVAFLEARFRDPNKIALLVRPYATKASTAGIFIWEGGSLQGDASYMEFPFRSSQLTTFRPSSLLADAPPPVLPQTAPAAPAAQPAPAAPKAPVRAQIVPIASRREVNLPPAPAAADPIKEMPAAVPEKAPEPIKVPVKVETAAPAKSAEPVKVATKPIPVVEPKKAEPQAEAKKPEPTKPQAPKNDEKKPEAKKSEAEKAEARKAEPQKAEPQKAEVKNAEAGKAEQADVKGSKSKLGLIAGGVAAAGFLAVGLFVYPGFLKHATIPATSQTSSLSLRTERTGTDILLTWNRDADAIRNAQHAVLYIFDGDRHENYEMDLGQLRNGSIVYSPITGDVSFRMDVNRKGKSESISESVRVLRTRPSPLGDDPQAAQAAQATQNGKPAVPAGKTPQTATPAADAPTDSASTEDTKPVTPTPTKPFDPSSLVQRLRPATQTDLLDAPTINAATPTAAAPGALTGLNLNGVAPAPAAPAPPAPTRTAAAPDKKGSAVSGGQIRQAELISRKEPEYPKLARQMGVKGVVELSATIGVDGRVKGVKVIKGHPLLSKAASDAVMQWIYKPTLLNGQAVQNDTLITLNFLGER